MNAMYNIVVAHANIGIQFTYTARNAHARGVITNEELEFELYCTALFRHRVEELKTLYLGMNKG
jgi:hypothetical protein